MAALWPKASRDRLVDVPGTSSRDRACEQEAETVNGTHQATRSVSPDTDALLRAVTVLG